jgi:hypothetical protein
MAKIKLTFQCSLKFLIGNGRKTLFSEDYWLEQLLCILYPLLYTQARHKKSTIEETYNEESWQLFFHQPVLNF